LGSSRAPDGAGQKHHGLSNTIDLQLLKERPKYLLRARMSLIIDFHYMGNGQLRIFLRGR
jgi:DNA phosphorothioation-dependent restriction protein DptG